MICIKCNAAIPEHSLYCNICGAKQTPAKRSSKKRGNGQGCVYKRGSTWQAEITLGYYTRDGKRLRKRKTKCGFAKKKDALAWISTMQTGGEERKPITVAILWEQFRADLDTLSRSKRTAYGIAWRKISAEVEYRCIDELTVSELQEIVDSHAQSYYTARDIKSLLSHLYKLAIRDDYVDKNRATFIRLPELHSTEREVMTDDEIKALWSDWRASQSRVTAQMLVMLYTGIRPGELLDIRRDMVHLDEQWMSGGKKTAKGKNRKIIIPDRIVPIIEQMLAEGRDKIAYYRKTDDFYTAWKDKRVVLGIREDITPYCCRHTYITRLTALKVSPAMLQELAGHEDYDTTLDYTHLSVADRLAEVNRLE